MEIKIFNPRSIPENAILECQELLARIWPPKHDRTLEGKIQEYRDADEETEYFLGLIDDRIVAHTKIFPRTITTTEGDLTIMALAAVCVDPELRGGGFGKQIVSKAFEHVDSGAYPVSIFQTGVSDFYRKLNCRSVDNKFTNSQDSEGKNPWWDVDIMIYPESYPWPTGTIDMNGYGY